MPPVSAPVMQWLAVSTQLGVTRMPEQWCPVLMVIETVYVSVVSVLPLATAAVTFPVGGSCSGVELQPAAARREAMRANEPEMTRREGVRMRFNVEAQD